MNQYFPFMHEKKKDKEPELIPLYVEIDVPTLPKKKDKDDEAEKGIVIIELF